MGEPTAIPVCLACVVGICGRDDFHSQIALRLCACARVVQGVVQNSRAGLVDCSVLLSSVHDLGYMERAAWILLPPPRPLASPAARASCFVQCSRSVGLGWEATVKL